MSAPAADFDAASGESLRPEAREVLLAALERGYADPRRLHHRARDARLLLDNAREATAQALGVRAEEVTFTPSGTHAVHLGLLGLAGRALGSGRPIAYSAVEHSAVLHAARWAGAGAQIAAAAGLEIGLEIPVDRLGRVRVDEVPSDAAVVAVQSANHEVGTLQPVEVVAERTGAPVFMDACASMGRLPLPGGWAAAAGSAHKWGGPAGVGVLLVRKRARWHHPFPADDRADPRATGFENVPAALAAAAALQAAVAEREETGPRQHDQIDRIRAAAARIPDVEVVGDADARLPHLVTFSCLYLDGETLVHELDRHGFGVASGSACTASTLEPSHVLAAMGALTHGNVRVSLTRDATDDQVARFCRTLPEVVADLRSRVGL